MRMEHESSTPLIDANLMLDVVDYLMDADCFCRPATDEYAAHICKRCSLLERLGELP